MRIRLPESERTRARRPGAALASALLHAVLIALAVNATVREPQAAPAPRTPALIYVAPPTRTDVRESAARTGAPAGPGAPRRTTIAPPDVRLPDVALPGPIDVELSIPGMGLATPTFDGDAMRGAASGAPTAPASGDGVLDARHVERAAAPLGAIRPRYPDALRARGADGAVLARYVVDSAGRVRDASIEIVEATDPLLAAAVRAALRDARFRPAEANGRRVAQLVEQRFLFALRDR